MKRLHKISYIFNIFIECFYSTMAKVPITTATTGTNWSCYDYYKNTLSKRRDYSTHFIFSRYLLLLP
ncbi:hypothetical protein LEQ41_05760 [Streptococcus agalactiae]|nr:hypothetical protein [Streptococcus agalactiae]